jgi:hypothetical protein
MVQARERMANARSSEELSSARGTLDSIRAEAEAENERRFEEVRQKAKDALDRGDKNRAVEAWTAFEPVYDPVGRWRGLADVERRAANGEKPPVPPAAPPVKPLVQRPPVRVEAPAPKDERKPVVRRIQPLKRPVAWTDVPLHDIRRVRPFFAAAVGPDPKLREEMQQAIGWHGKTYENELRTALEDKNDDWSYVVLSLAYAEDAAGLKHLSGLLQSEHPVVRANAVEASRFLKTRLDPKALTGLWECEEPLLQLAAARTLSLQLDKATLRQVQDWARSRGPHADAQRPARDLFAAYVLALRDKKAADSHLALLRPALGSQDLNRSSLGFRLLADLALSGYLTPAQVGDVLASAEKLLYATAQPQDVRLLAAGLLADADPRLTVTVRDLVRRIERNTLGVAESAVVVFVVDDALDGLQLRGLGRLVAWSFGRSFLSAEGGLAIGLVSLSEKCIEVLDPTRDPTRTCEAFEQLAMRTSKGYKNTLEAVRLGGQMVCREGKGLRNVVLCTLDNADVEDDVEETAGALVNAQARFYSITPEAVYSDHYWKAGRVRTQGKDYLLQGDRGQWVRASFAPHGPESAEVEFPFQWWFTTYLYMDDTTLTVPAGHPHYAPARLAHITGGHAYIYAPPPAPSSRGRTGFCASLYCPQCRGTHDSCTPLYSEAKLVLTAPFLGSRDEYVEDQSRSPLYRALIDAWEEAAKLSLVTHPPPLRWQSDKLVPRPPDDIRWRSGAPIWSTSQRLGANSSWVKLAEQARETAGRTAEIRKRLDVTLGEVVADRANLRVRATAETLALFLDLSRLNHLLFEQFCLKQVDAGTKSEPETYILKRVARNLCHGGGESLAGLALPAGDEWPSLGSRLDAQIEKHRGTPWEVLIRRAIILDWQLWIPPPPTGGPVTSERPQASSERDASPTPTSRPSRGAPSQGDGSSSGGTPTGTPTKP